MHLQPTKTATTTFKGSGNEPKSIVLSLAMGLPAFYGHVLQHHLPNSDTSEPDIFSGKPKGYLAIAFHLDLDEADPLPTKAEIVLDHTHQLTLAQRRGVEIYYVHLLDLQEFVDAKTTLVFRGILSHALEHLNFPLTRYIKDGLKASRD